MRAPYCIGMSARSVSNAGVMMTPAPVGEVDSEKWERVMRINLIDTYLPMTPVTIVRKQLALQELHGQPSVAIGGICWSAFLPLTL